VQFENPQDQEVSSEFKLCH